MRSGHLHIPLPAPRGEGLEQCPLSVLEGMETRRLLWGGGFCL